MTQMHAKRRGVAPRPSEAHLRMLSRLVKRAQVALNSPDDADKALMLTKEAERVAKKAVLPVGHQQNERSPVVKLIRLSKDWFAMGGERRAQSARGLASLAGKTREIVDEALLALSAPAAHSRRKDLDA